MQRLLCGEGLIAQEICTTAMVSRIRFEAEDSPVAVEYVIVAGGNDGVGGVGDIMR